MLQQLKQCLFCFFFLIESLLYYIYYPKETVKEDSSELVL